MNQTITSLIFSPADLQLFIYSLNPLQVFFGAFVGFSLIYFSLSALGFFYGHILCKRMGLGEMIDKRPLFKGQLFWEIKHSFLSIAIFAFYGVLTVYVDKNNILSISWTLPSAFVFLRDLLIISIWNEIHFYAIHRLLHHPRIYRKVHHVHHRSVTTTPFSTYSFHWIESTALSSVMILAMVFWTFNIYVLILFPLVSLMMNTIGHLNFTIFSKLSINHIASASRRHADHHRRFNGNYGFLLPYLDRIFSTKLPAAKN